MKTILLTVFLLSQVTLIGQDVRSTTHQFDEIDHLVIANINGSVSVQGTDRQDVFVTVEEEWGSKSSQEEIHFDSQLRGDTLILYIQNPCGPAKSITNHHDKYWSSYEWNDCDYEMDYHADLQIEIPENIIAIWASTMNDGDIDVTNTDARVGAFNLNGEISLKSISNPINVFTLNGDIHLNSPFAPTIDCRFYTMNGDIEVVYPKDFSAKASFASFQGDFYTDVDDISYLNPTKKQEKGKIIIDNNQRVQFGMGGPQLDFETFNGDLIVKTN